MVEKYAHGYTSDLEAPLMNDCKCGIPNCPGHEIKDGKVVIKAQPESKK
jgi:hypothetical protein